MICNEYEIDNGYNEILKSTLHAEKNQITIIWDDNDKVLLVTKTLESYFNLKTDDLINSNWSIIFPNDIVHQIKDHFKSTSSPFKNTQYLLPSKDDNLTHFKIFIEKIITSSKLMYICILKDITEEQLLKNKLYNLEKTFLTASMSAQMVHEIRNSLTAIKGFLQLIQAGIEHREEYVRILLLEVEKIEGLTNELLQLANPNKKERKKVSLKELLSDVLMLMEAQTKMQKINFNVTGDLDTFLYCNPIEIKQVLINLILNGVEAMDYSGTIKLHVARLEDSVIIEVIDEGHGMSEQIVKEINNEYYTTKENGTGLGLVVTEQIIEQHQGRLSVTSSENVGSIFEVKLPI